MASLKATNRMGKVFNVVALDNGKSGGMRNIVARKCDNQDDVNSDWYMGDIHVSIVEQCERTGNFVIQL